MVASLQTQTSQAVGTLEQKMAEAQQQLLLGLKAQADAQQERIETSLKKANDDALLQIDQYKKARLSLLDTHIERLIEDVTTRVLHKKLTVTEHAELARNALAEAKEHNLI
jgi:hypothetical protein